MCILLNHTCNSRVILWHYVPWVYFVNVGLSEARFTFLQGELLDNARSEYAVEITLISTTYLRLTRLQQCLSMVTSPSTQNTRAGENALGRDKRITHKYGAQTQTCARRTDYQNTVDGHVKTERYPYRREICGLPTEQGGPLSGASPCQFRLPVQI